MLVSSHAVATASIPSNNLDNTPHSCDSSKNAKALVGGPRYSSSRDAGSPEPEKLCTWRGSWRWVEGFWKFYTIRFYIYILGLPIIRIIVIISGSILGSPTYGNPFWPNQTTSLTEMPPTLLRVIYGWFSKTWFPFLDPYI